MVMSKMMVYDVRIPSGGENMTENGHIHKMRLKIPVSGIMIKNMHFLSRNSFRTVFHRGSF